jgi:hypothetical protein
MTSPRRAAAFTVAVKSFFSCLLVVGARRMLSLLRTEIDTKRSQGWAGSIAQTACRGKCKRTLVMIHLEFGYAALTHGNAFVPSFLLPSLLRGGVRPANSCVKSGMLSTPYPFADLRRPGFTQLQHVS